MHIANSALGKAGLVLTGGGARAAYQVGVLRAVSDLLPDLNDPFRVICGTSAGAINAVALAGGDDIFRHNVGHLERLWARLKIEDIYRADVFGMSRWMTGFVRGILQGQGDEPVSLLDNRPLRAFLEKEMHFDAIARSIDEGRLDAIGINACAYTAGQNVCFFQGKPEVASWDLGQRVGAKCQLTLDHVMASSAIPTIFPPVKLNREYFGDGVTRQMAHISPALHMGADRVLVIGVSANRVSKPVRFSAKEPPSLAKVMEHVLNGLFLDTMEYDIDRLITINRLVDLIPEEKRQEAGLNLRPVKLLDISPSRPINEIASQYLDGLPLILRRLLGRNLEKGEGGASLASYLLFDHRFCRDLIALGYQDAQAQAHQLVEFLDPRASQEISL
ncbi:patatin-like phospholipase family protein [Mangrovitalea sediminis]|uniref:patatin-like phospholipase family protein n=1 Tax=Mangrovitalea sediminis TaxID=1982043 RepID=UPI001D0D4195|nr:patatin-like phospholipase family protein [Mangrovitalea sediminis]